MDRRFLVKAIERIDRVDKKRLEEWVEELKKEGQSLHEILHSVREGLVVVDDKLRVDYVNRTAQLILGSPSLLRRQEPLRAIVEDAGLRSQITEQIRMEKELDGETVQILNPHHVVARLDVQKLQGKRYLILLTPQDRQDERQQEKVQFEKMASLFSLANGIAHEIGNPLNSINIHLQLLLKDVGQLPKAQQVRLKKSLQVVIEETGRLDRIVRNFLKANRRKPLQFQIGSVNEIVRDTLELLTPELGISQIKVRTDLDGRIPDFFVDAERLTQVFVNLAKNAIQAMPSGGELRVATALDHRACHITFTDTGIGISKKDMNRIFEAYYTTKEEGSGLGLMIAYQIIREHGGRIEVASKPGKGTVVDVVLPVRKEKLQLPPPEHTARQGRAG